MLLGRWEGAQTYDFSKNAALGTGSPTQQQLSQVEQHISDFQAAETAIARPSPPDCDNASPASTTGTGMAGILAGAPRQAPGLKPSFTSLKMVRRFCAITFTHAIFPSMGKSMPRQQMRARKM